MCLRVGDSDLNLYARLYVDGRDLLHDLRRGVQVDDSLVDAHLEPVPSLGTLTTRGLAGGDAEDLRWHADGALEDWRWLVSLI